MWLTVWLACANPELAMLRQAVEAYETVIKKYPKEDVAVQAQFDIGSLYESQTDFEKAAKAFIQMERFKTHDKASDAIRNAGLIYVALEQYRAAHETFERYLKTFKQKDDVKEVATGFECGIGCDRFANWEERDIIEAHKLVTKRRTLSSS